MNQFTTRGFFVRWGLACILGLHIAGGPLLAADPEAPAPAIPAAASPPAGEKTATAATRPGGFDLLYLSSTGPLILRLTITANDQPLETSLEPGLDRLFALLDKNGDATLNDDERRQIPSRLTLQDMQLISRTGTSTSLLQSDARRSVATRADLQRYYEKLGLQALRLNYQVSPATPDDGTAMLRPSPGQSAGQGAGQVAPNLFQRLMDRIDADRNGALSAPELAAGQALLRSCDLNRDENLSASEFIVLGSPGRSDATAPAIPRASKSLSTRLFLLTGQSPDRLRSIGQACAAYYSRSIQPLSPAMTLSREQSLLPEAMFTRLDRGGDGQIDAEDWDACFDAAQSDLAVSIAFGKTAATNRATDRLVVQDLANVSRGPQRCNYGGGSDLQIQNERLQLRTADNNPDKGPEAFLKDLFPKLDRDKNDYIDRNEATQMRVLDFRELDVDRNGMVFLNEFLDRATPLWTLASYILVLSVESSGFDLFAAMDVNQDRLLSVREVRNLSTLFPQWDGNGDGLVAAGELPSYLTLNIVRGLTAERFAISGGTDGFVPPSPPKQVNAGSPVNSSIPWFQQMDRNEDGDVSRREFLGELKLFDSWDTDHDGLLSLEEARAITRSR
jgi:Ca2+-binding EF-hand superfamily protein